MTTQVLTMPKTNRTKRNDIAVKVDAGVIASARVVVAHRNITLAEYLSDLLRPLVERDLKKTGREITGEKKPD